MSRNHLMTFTHEESQTEVRFQEIFFSLGAITAYWTEQYGHDDPAPQNVFQAAIDMHDEFLERIADKRATETYYQERGIKVLT